MRAMMTGVSNKFIPGPTLIETADYNITDFVGTRKFTGPVTVSNIFQSTAFSYSCWFKITDTGTPQSLVRLSGTGIDVALVNDWTTLDAGNADVLTFALNDNVDFNANAIRSTSSVQDGLLHHAACTFNGTVAFLYVDGVQESTAVLTAPITAGGGITIANSHFGSSEDCTGEQCNIVVHDTALTGPQVIELYNSTRPRQLNDYSSGIISSYIYAFSGMNTGEIDTAGLTAPALLNGATTDGSLVEFDITPL